MQQTFRQLLLHTKLPIILILMFSGILWIQSDRLDSNPQEEKVSQSAIEKKLETSKLNLKIGAQIPSFGFRNLLADWVFLRFLQYFGDDIARAKTGYGLSPDYFKAIVNRDPFFTDTYSYLFTSVSLYTGQPETAIALIDKALESMSPTRPSTSYLIWRNKSIDELLLLNDVDKAISSLRTAAEWAEQSPAPGAEQVAQTSRQSAEFLKTNPDSRIARALAWSNIIVRAVDDRSRQLAIKKVEEFGGQVTIENGAVRVFIPAQAQGK